MGRQPFMETAYFQLCHPPPPPTSGKTAPETGSARRAKGNAWRALLAHAEAGKEVVEDVGGRIFAEEGGEREEGVANGDGGGQDLVFAGGVERGEGALEGGLDRAQGGLVAEGDGDRRLGFAGGRRQEEGEEGVLEGGQVGCPG